MNERLDTDNPRETDLRIEAFAARAHRGYVVSREELLARGLSEDQIDRRVRRGFLRRIYPGVYAVGREAVEPEARIRAALLTAGPAAAAAEDTAAFVHRLLTAYPAPPRITTPYRTGRNPKDPVLRHPRHPPQTQTVRGLRVTTVPQTIADLAAIRHPQLQRALNEALYLRATSLEDLAPFAHGRRGARLLRDTIAKATAAHSALEDEFYALLHHAGLPLPLGNARVGPYRVDFLWQQQRLIVETDGWGAHGHELARNRTDPAKTAHLKALGYTVIRIPRHRLRTRPYEVIAELSVALQQRQRTALFPTYRDP